MNFKLLGTITDVRDFEYEEPVISPHTGNELERIYINLKVEQSMISDFRNKLQDLKEGDIFSIDDENHILKEYRLLDSSYSYDRNTDNTNDILNYELHLEEVEKLEIKSLIIRDMEVFPYHYNESYEEDKDSIVIDARVQLSKDKIDELLDFDSEDRYFPVIRNGISDEKLEMRFGTVVWSEDGENIKLNLIFVEKSYDENNKHPSRLFEPELSNIMGILAYTKKLNNELIDLLISKNLVSIEEIDALKMKSKNGRRKAYHDFYKVKDIDDFCE